MSSQLRLPPEVILEVLENIHSAPRSTWYNTTLVSSWMRRASIPHLYSSVVLRNVAHVQSFLQVIKAPSDSDLDGTGRTFLTVSPGQYVHHLSISEDALDGWIANKTDRESLLQTILRACPKVTSAVLPAKCLSERVGPIADTAAPKLEWITITGKATAEDWETVGRLVEASISQVHEKTTDVITSSPSTETLHPEAPFSILHFTTHLRICDPFPNRDCVAVLGRLPHLTHLSVTIYDWSHWFATIKLLRRPTAIMQLVPILHFYSPETSRSSSLSYWSLMENRRDERLFPIGRFEEDVLETGEGGDVWSRAVRARLENDRICESSVS